MLISVPEGCSADFQLYFNLYNKPQVQNHMVLWALYWLRCQSNIQNNWGWELRVQFSSFHVGIWCSVRGLMEKLRRLQQTAKNLIKQRNLSVSAAISNKCWIKMIRMSFWGNNRHIIFTKLWIESICMWKGSCCECWCDKPSQRRPVVHSAVDTWSELQIFTVRTSRGCLSARTSSWRLWMNFFCVCVCVQVCVFRCSVVL